MKEKSGFIRENIFNLITTFILCEPKINIIFLQLNFVGSHHPRMKDYTKANESQFEM